MPNQKSKFFKKIGKLNNNIVNDLLTMILPFEDKYNNGFQRVEFNTEIYQYLKDIFVNKNLKVQQSYNKEFLVQKAFLSGVNYSFPIHKDGIQCKSALNIALQCNESDWIRWYSDKLINKLSSVELLQKDKKSTRNSTISKDLIPELKFLAELKVEPGDVYTLDVNTFHTWYCAGPKKRIIIQTKFEGFPDFKFITKLLSKESYSGLTLF